MIRVGRDHGTPLHIVRSWPLSELVTYAAHYQFDFEVEKKAQEKAQREARIKK